MDSSADSALHGESLQLSAKIMNADPDKPAVDAVGSDNEQPSEYPAW